MQNLWWWTSFHHINISDFLPVTAIITFVLKSVFYACIGWTVSYEELQSIFVFSYVLIDFPFFQITSDYLISCFRWSFSGETNANLSFYVYQTIAVFCPLNVPSCSPI